MTSQHRRRGVAGYDLDMGLGALELFYAFVLVLGSLAIGWFALYAVYTLFKGQG